VMLVILLFALLIIRIMLVGRRNQLRGSLFAAYVAYGIAIWFGIQAIVNMGVNAGMFPTKGLTLPFLSYGGSSLLIDCLAIGILLRIDHEARLAMLGLRKG
jgi:cell division protein FtsW